MPIRFGVVVPFDDSGLAGQPRIAARSTRVDLDIAVFTGRRNEGLSVVRSAAQFDKEIGEI